MKKLLTVALSFLLAASLLAGCGASSRNATTAPSAAPSPSPSAENYGYASDSIANESVAVPEGEASKQMLVPPGGASGAGLADRKIIKNGSIELETLEFDKGIAAITALVEELGGYIEGSEISGISLRYRGDYNQRAARFSARIPSDKLNQATDELGQLFNVLNKNESSSDITETYFDTESRLKSLRIQEERLLDLLSKAEKLEDLITLERALADVRYQIESLTSQLNRYDNLVSYSTLSIYLQEVVQTTNVKAQPRTLSEKVAEAFTESLEGIAEIAEFILLTVVALGPVLLVYGGVVALLVFGILRLRRSAAGRKAGKSLPRPTDEAGQRPSQDNRDETNS